MIDALSAQKDAEAELVPVIEIKALAPAVRVESQPDFEYASELLRRVKGEAKRVEEKRDGFLRPAADFARSVRDFYRPVLEAYDHAEASLKGLLSAYAARVAQEREAAMLSAAPAAAPALPAAEGIRQRVKTKFRIVSEQAVPREFCSPDEKKIRSFLATNPNGSIPYPNGIPGVRVYQEVEIAAGAK